MKSAAQGSKVLAYLQMGVRAFFFLKLCPQVQDHLGN